MSEISALPTYRPDCSGCTHSMDEHFGDASDAGCWEDNCQCMGYRYPWETPVEGFPDQEFLTDDAAGIVGDCWRACVAGMLGRSSAGVPHFVAEETSEHDWLEATQEWLRRETGFQLLYVMPNFPIKSVVQHAIMVGRSPRGLGHAVLVNASTGAIVHDPHPSRDGLETIAGVFALTPPWEDTDA